MSIYKDIIRDDLHFFKCQHVTDEVENSESFMNTEKSMKYIDPRHPNKRKQTDRWKDRHTNGQTYEHPEKKQLYGHTERQTRPTLRVSLPDTNNWDIYE